MPWPIMPLTPVSCTSIGGVASLPDLEKLIDDQFGGTGDIGGRTPDTLNTPGFNWAYFGEADGTVAGGRATDDPIADAGVAVNCGTAIHAARSLFYCEGVSNQSAALVGRGVDKNNYWGAFRNGPTLVLQEVTAATAYSRDSDSPAYAPAADDWETIIECTSGGVEVWYKDDRGAMGKYISSVHNTGTSCGLKIRGGPLNTGFNADWFQVWNRYD